MRHERDKIRARRRVIESAQSNRMTMMFVGIVIGFHFNRCRGEALLIMQFESKSPSPNFDHLAFENDSGNASPQRFIAKSTTPAAAPSPPASRARTRARSPFVPRAE